MKIMVLVAILFVLVTKEAGTGWFIAISAAFLIDTVISVACYGGDILRQQEKKKDPKDTV